jgi:5-methyltetrahydropteroyltriglutamate--homocysteine methyltransferase
MKRSTDRILTTHVGSLPRPPAMVDMIRAQIRGEAVDPAAYAKTLRESVASVVEKQKQLGIDIVDDGECGKPSYVSYANDRLGGFTPRTVKAETRSPWLGSREALTFPDYYAEQLAGASSTHKRLVCTAPVTYTGHAQLKVDLDNLRAAADAAGATDVFVPSVSPASFEDWNRNEFYKTPEEYVVALGEAMREEYKGILGAGFLLQIDDPRLVTHYMLHPEESIADCRKWAQLRAEALNHSLRGLPRERIRYHTCYGINIGPRVHDMELKDVIDIVLSIEAGAYSFEASNPRHEHEWAVWKDAKLPEGAILIPGVITHSTVLVEHPELVAQRIVRFAQAVGRENVIAGTDCGFATFAGADEIHPSIVWAKFESLVKGAEIASRELWT